MLLLGIYFSLTMFCIFKDLQIIKIWDAYVSISYYKYKMFFL